MLALTFASIFQSLSQIKYSKCRKMRQFLPSISTFVDFFSF